MRTFIAKSKKTGLKITFKYDFDGVLRVLEFDGEWTPERVQKIIPRIPITTMQMLADIKAQNRIARGTLQRLPK